MKYTKKELKFYLLADRMMNRGCFTYPIRQKILRLFVRDYIMDYLESLRRVEFYGRRGGVYKLLYGYYAYRHKMLGLKLGLSINANSLGYGVVIPHHGTIVVGENKIGNYAVLHTSTCISGNGKIIGDGLYLAVGAKITKKCTLGNGVTVGANAVVCHDFGDNVLLTGIPATKKKNAVFWCFDSGKEYLRRYKEVERLKLEYGI